ncbi:MAG: hypothetical protein NDJ90_06025 [Oligoflexia bacterium]|nr:hypothetical protein [Oligoflexia bacterium]
MERFPGNLGPAAKACGTCHGEIYQRVQGTLMNTRRGMLAVNRQAFGEKPAPHAPLGNSPADRHFRQLCSECHLGFDRKKSPRTQADFEDARGGGCMACHLGSKASFHVPITVRIGNQNCFGCHSRSGRISLSYEGWHETTFEEAPRSWPKDRSRVLADGRVLQKELADIHFERGMTCVDCHTSRELMGDGRAHLHQEDQIEIACTDCHRVSSAKTIRGAALDAEGERLLRARRWPSAPDTRYVLTEGTRQPLINVTLPSPSEPRKVLVRSKIDDRRLYSPKAPGASCGRDGNHERLSCRSCHTAWAPQCIGCHTEEGRDGRWLESVGNFHVSPPVLGVSLKTRKIEPFVPGMVFTLKKNGAEERLVRLHAPISPHTTRKEARSCDSCHLDPLAVGLGRGTLEFRGKDGEAIHFVAAYEKRADGLPADAWVGQAESKPPRRATRANVRPLDGEERRRVLRVGYCLKCHRPESPEAARVFTKFAEADPRCRRRTK